MFTSKRNDEMANPNFDRDIESQGELNLHFDKSFVISIQPFFYASNHFFFLYQNLSKSAALNEIFREGKTG